MIRALLASLLAATVACGDRRAEPDTAASAPTVDPEAEFRAQLGRSWELVRMGGRDVPPPPAGTPEDSVGRDLVPGRRPTLGFALDPTGAGGRSFCNGYGGPFVFRGDSLRITEIVSSAVGCDGPDSVETRYFRGLRMTRRFELGRDSLKLIAEDGSALVFVPAGG